jgi:hypothetical protein
MAGMVGLDPTATYATILREWKHHQLEIRLGKITEKASLLLGAVVMLCTFGASERALAAAGHGDAMRDDV